MTLSFHDPVGVACRLHIQLPAANPLYVVMLWINKLFPFQMPSSLNVPICFCLANFGTKEKTWTQPLAAALNAPVLCEANISLSRVVSRANRKHVVHGGERGHVGADGSDGHV